MWCMCVCVGLQINGVHANVSSSSSVWTLSITASEEVILQVLYHAHNAKANKYVTQG